MGRACARPVGSKNDGSNQPRAEGWVASQRSAGRGCAKWPNRPLKSLEPAKSWRPAATPRL
eukprot:14123959-Alexandrium_andersonii.AAC.1